jgi:hypothetical protein
VHHYGFDKLGRTALNSLRFSGKRYFDTLEDYRRMQASSKDKFKEYKKTCPNYQELEEIIDGTIRYLMTSGSGYQERDTRRAVCMFLNFIGKYYGMDLLKTWKKKTCFKQSKSSDSKLQYYLNRENLRLLALGELTRIEYYFFHLTKQKIQEKTNDGSKIIIKGEVEKEEEIQLIKSYLKILLKRTPGINANSWILRLEEYPMQRVIRILKKNEFY